MKQPKTPQTKASAPVGGKALLELINELKKVRIKKGRIHQNMFSEKKKGYTLHLYSNLELAKLEQQERELTTQIEALEESGRG